MLVKFDEHDENAIYDFVQGKFVEGKEMHAHIGKRKSVLPFSGSMSIKKLRPRTKMNRKFGDSWLSAQKLTMAYILAGFMLKTGKTRLAGFLKKTEKNYIFIEVTIGTGSVTAKYKWITDNPQDFLAIEGKTYDIIIGDPNVATDLVDWEKLWKEYSRDAKPLQMILAALVIVSVTIGMLYTFGIVGAKKKTPIRTAPAAPEQIPPLSSGEIRVLSLLLTQEILQEYKSHVEALEQTPDIAVSVATIQIRPLSEHKISATLSITYQSIYPYPSSLKEGDFYVMRVEKSLERQRRDISRAVSLVDTVKDNYMTALGALMDAGDVAAREDGGWKFAVVIEKDYARTAAMLNRIYFSPAVVKSLTIDETSTRGEIFLNNL